MIFPTKEVFEKLAEKGNVIPVYQEVSADVETPVSAFMKLDDGGQVFLFESVERGEKFGRYSFLGANPRIIFEMKDGVVKVTEDGEVEEYASEKDPLKELEDLMSRYQPVSSEDYESAGGGKLPIFYGGAVGCLSFESVRYFEPTVGMAKENDLEFPDAYFFVSDSILIFDHLTRRVKILINAHVDGDASEAYEQALAKIADIQKALRKPVSVPMFDVDEAMNGDAPDVNMTKEYYLKMTERMQEHIRAGDIFQVVPSQRFSVDYGGDAIDLYRALRFINPSPYMFCLKLDGFSVVGASPETHVRCENGHVDVRPIAGTRKRGADVEEDGALADELLGDPKENAEHLMLVDLGRNDLGRVCEFHSVKVTDFRVIERYSHVMHIVSHVEGQLEEGMNSYDVMRATFPAGTVSGSPKIRAMQIIAENEPTRRGIYSGAVGYFGFSGNLDSCIAIRTIFLKDGVAYVQAGGGLVADSTPEGEYDESVNKSKACLKAIMQAKRLETKNEAEEEKE